MNTEIFLDLRPKTATAAAIEASIEAADARRQNIELGLTSLLARRGEMLVSGTPAAIRAHENEIKDAEIHILQLQSFVDALAEPLSEAKHREKVEALQKQLADIAAPEKIFAFVVAWREEYPKAAAAIAAILALEVAADQAAISARRIRDQLSALGVEVEYPPAACMAAVGGVLRDARCLGDLVQLPGVLGAPNIPIVNNTVVTARKVARPDYAAPGWNPNHPPMTIVEEKEERTVRSMAREDKPFWWPKPAS